MSAAFGRALSPRILLRLSPDLQTPGSEVPLHKSTPYRALGFRVSGLGFSV